MPPNGGLYRQEVVIVPFIERSSSARLFSPLRLLAIRIDPVEEGLFAALVGTIDGETRQHTGISFEIIFCVAIDYAHLGVDQGGNHENPRGTCPNNGLKNNAVRHVPWSGRVREPSIGVSPCRTDIAPLVSRSIREISVMTTTSA